MDGQAIKDTLGRNIKILRARRGLSQADLAEKADISIPFLSAIERGLKFPQPEIMSKIATALGAEVNQFFVPNLDSPAPNPLLSHLSENFTKDVNSAMEQVIRRYLG